MSSWVSYSSNYYCLLLAVVEEATRCMYCTFSDKSVFEVGQVPHMYIKHTVNALFIGPLSEMGCQKTQ